MFIFTSLFALVLVVVSGCHGWEMTTRLFYEGWYDESDVPVTLLACATFNGGEGSLGDLPNYPYIGAMIVAPDPDWGCGDCLKVTSDFATVNIAIVDANPNATGLVVSHQAMNVLTGGHVVQLGMVNVTVDKLDASDCNISSP